MKAFYIKLANFKQIVPVFTNVIFDTSQPHSNVVFPHMFAWLDLVLEIAREHPDTLFVIRAHPDEARPGKASQESVSQWVNKTNADSLPNLIFVDSDQPLSSYELIQRSKFVMVYNSTIGLEASILGIAGFMCRSRPLHPAAHGLFPCHPRGIPPAGGRFPGCTGQFPSHPSSNAMPVASCIISSIAPPCPSPISSRKMASGRVSSG